MIESILLASTIEREYPNLLALPGEKAAEKPDKPGAWSGKEELGHLLDSATNNHLRFVRAALEDGFTGLSYQQDGWVALHGYQEMPWSELIELWLRYNSLLVKLIERIPAEKSGVICSIGPNPPVTLAFLIDDYVLHMQHHLDHLLRKEKVTPYPRVSQQF